MGKEEGGLKWGEESKVDVGSPPPPSYLFPSPSIFPSRFHSPPPPSSHLILPPSSHPLLYPTPSFLPLSLLSPAHPSFLLPHPLLPHPLLPPTPTSCTQKKRGKKRKDLPSFPPSSTLFMNCVYFVLVSLTCVIV